MTLAKIFFFERNSSKFNSVKISLLKRKTGVVVVVYIFC